MFYTTVSTNGKVLLHFFHGVSGVGAHDRPINNETTY